ncbi:MAG: GIY-YIG nuclease family protein [Myxococcota bacterium]
MATRKPTRSTSKSKRKRSGYIYLLANPALKPNWHKIGKTTRTPEARAAEISRATGVPMPYEVVHREAVSDCHKAEQMVHNALSRYRAQDNREFFVLPRTTAIAAMQRAAARYPAGGSLARLQALSTQAGRQPRPLVAALLELGPGLFQTFGLGHMYAGKTAQGMAILLGYWAFMVLGCFAAPKTWSWLGIWALCWLTTTLLSTLFAVRAARTQHGQLPPAQGHAR